MYDLFAGFLRFASDNYYNTSIDKKAKPERKNFTNADKNCQNSNVVIPIRSSFYNNKLLILAQ